MQTTYCDLERVQDFLRQGTLPEVIASKIGYPLSVIKAIERGEEIVEYRAIRDNSLPVDLCTCCNENPKAPGFRFLCKSCYKAYPEVDVQSFDSWGECGIEVIEDEFDNIMESYNGT